MPDPKITLKSKKFQLNKFQLKKLSCRRRFARGRIVLGLSPDLRPKAPPGSTVHSPSRVGVPNRLQSHDSVPIFNFLTKFLEPVAIFNSFIVTWTCCHFFQNYREHKTSAILRSKPCSKRIKTSCAIPHWARHTWFKIAKVKKCQKFQNEAVFSFIFKLLLIKKKLNNDFFKYCFGPIYIA